MKVALREMTNDDWERVRDIYKDGIDTNKATFQTEAPTFNAWHKAYLENCRLIAEVDGLVVGWCALLPTSNRPVFQGVVEVSIYIDANYTGKGIGYALLNHQNVLAEREGFWTLQSAIMADNEASIALHSKCGYREVGYREKMGKDANGVWRDVILMERRSKLI